MTELVDTELKENFDEFLLNVDNYLIEIIDKANRQSYKLDFSLKTLKYIEKYIIRVDVVIDDDDYNDLSVYLGEVLRRNYGGKWICNLDKENNSLSYGFPVIEGDYNPGVLFSPFHVVKAFILRRKSGHFRAAIESYVHPK